MIKETIIPIDLFDLNEPNFNLDDDEKAKINVEYKRFSLGTRLIDSILNKD